MYANTIDLYRFSFISMPYNLSDVDQCLITKSVTPHELETRKDVLENFGQVNVSGNTILEEIVLRLDEKDTPKSFEVFSSANDRYRIDFIDYRMNKNKRGVYLIYQTYLHYTGKNLFGVSTRAVRIIMKHGIKSHPHEHLTK